jgi:hypothetical protein
MDFRGAVAGEFVYHCHILDHEDGGMMATILVEPTAPPKAARRELPTHQASLTRKGPGRTSAPTHV